MSTVTVDRAWCLTADRDRVVPETDPEARWLHWRAGDVVPLSEARRLGLVRDSSAPKRSPQPVRTRR